MVKTVDLIRKLPVELVQIIHAYAQFSQRMERRNRCAICDKIVGGERRGIKHHVRKYHKVIPHPRRVKHSANIADAMAEQMWLDYGPPFTNPYVSWTRYPNPPLGTYPKWYRITRR